MRITGGSSRELLQPVLETDQKPISSVDADLVGALALYDELLGAGLERRDANAQVQLERERERVETRSEVGAARRRLDGHRRVVKPVARAITSRALLGAPARSGRRECGGVASALGSVGILEAVAGEHAHDRRTRVQPARGGHLAYAGDGRGGCRLAEDALVAREVAIRGEDLLVGHGFDDAARLVARLERQVGPTRAGRS